MRDNSCRDRGKRGCLSRFHDGIIFQIFSIDLTVILTRGYITIMDISEGVQSQGFFSLNISILYPFIKLVYVFPSLLSTTPLVERVFRLFSSCFTDTVLFQSFCMLWLKNPPCIVVVVCVCVCVCNWYPVWVVWPNYEVMKLLPR